MPSNTAAWQKDKTTSPLEVKSAPYTSPVKHEIVVKNAVVAINPIDWIIQRYGNLVYSWLKYPFVLGSDVAGEVVEVGPGVTRFKAGDRVIALATGSDKTRNSAAGGAFQDYVVIQDQVAAPIPHSMSYETAVVMPLGLSTAACCLFQKDHLAMDYPTTPAKPSNGKTLLVWGASTSVGSNAVQLAVAAGCEVIATAGPRNFEYVKKLGASRVFDYNSTTVVEDLKKAFKGKSTAGAISIGPGAIDACIDVLASCSGGHKFISVVAGPKFPDGALTGLTFVSFVLKFLWGNVSVGIRTWRHGIKSKFVIGSDLKDNEVAKVVFEDFLPQALAEDAYKAWPEPKVFGHGLERIQAAMDAQRNGVSAMKLVVTL